MGRDREKGGWWVWEEIERKVAGGCGKRHRERWRVGLWVGGETEGKSGRRMNE